MLLSHEELKKLVLEQNLVERLLKEELERPVGTGFDFRAGEIHRIRGASYIGAKRRLTPESKVVAAWESDPSHHVIKPGEYYLLKTIEKVNLPSDIMLVFYPRSSFFRSGISVHTGLADPGFSGELTFGITNLSGHNFTLEMGARIAHGIFFRVSGGRTYRGFWQGGKMT